VEPQNIRRVDWETKNLQYQGHVDLENEGFRTLDAMDDEPLAASGYRYGAHIVSSAYS
jgi:hypothetical protein